MRDSVVLNVGFRQHSLKTPSLQLSFHEVDIGETLSRIEQLSIVSDLVPTSNSSSELRPINPREDILRRIHKFAKAIARRGELAFPLRKSK